MGLVGLKKESQLGRYSCPPVHRLVFLLPHSTGEVEEGWIAEDVFG